MKRLILLRHAKSSWNDERLSDHDRPLNRRGQLAAPLMAREIAKRGWTPALILCSTARRTEETVALCLPFFTPVPELRMEPGLYLASEERILERLHLLDTKAGTVMITGHNPGMHDVALQLAGAAAQRTGLHEKFPTCAAALFESTARSWREAARGAWRLHAFLRPRDLDP